MATTAAGTSRDLAIMATPGFPQFSQMPPEIRRAIWREAALTAYVNRHLVLGDSQYHFLTALHNGKGGFKPSIHVSPRMKPSSIFLVNRESRQVARSIYNVRLHVYDTLNDYDSFNGFEAPSYPNGGLRNVIYKGEVYISLVHDVFVSLDDTSLRDSPPEDWDGGDCENWTQYKITGRLSDHQVNSIERIMIVHWLGLSASDGDGEWPPRATKAMIDNAFDERDSYHNFEEMFKGARSRWDLFKADYPSYGDVNHILKLSTGTLLKLYYRGHYRFSKLSPASLNDSDNSGNGSGDSESD